MEQPTPEVPRCKICGKRPAELEEYAERARTESKYFKDADDVVRKDEGTYNRETGAFYCTDCYVDIGMPVGTA